MKKLLASLSILLLLAPLAQAQTVKSSEEFTSPDIFFTLDFRVTGKIKKLLEPVIKKYVADEKNSSTSEEELEVITMFANKILAGERFFLSFNAEETSSFMSGVMVSFPAARGEFDTLIKDFEKEKYGSTQIYNDGNEYNPTYYTYLGGLAIISLSKKTIESSIDRAEGKLGTSLITNTDYQKVARDLLDSRFFGVVIDYSKLVELAEESLGTGEEEIEVFKEVLNFLRFQGLSIAETSQGYEFNIKTLGNPEKLRAEGISPTESKNFTPNLYKKFPDARPIFYSESFNAKEYQRQLDKVLEQSFGLKKSLGASAFGLDIKALNNLFEKESAVAVQYKKGELLPYFTLLGDVESTKKEAAEFADSLEDILKKMKLPRRAYSVLPFQNANGKFYRFSFDLSKIPGVDSNAPFPKVVLTAGVTSDNLFILSTYPGIEDASVRKGFADDTEFSSYAAIRQPATSIAYLNVRNFWRWMDELLAQYDGGSLSTQQNYYMLAEKLYPLRDVMVVSQGNSFESETHGAITIDGATHTTYAKFVQKLKAQDEDGDGVNDYEERYLYHTPTQVKDSDDDGVSDVEELKKGSNPKSKGRIFSDVPEGTFYTEAVSSLYNQGAVKGYDDASFKPGRAVNRAEFTKMIVNVFGEEMSAVKFLSQDDAHSIFSDVSSKEWHYAPISEAYRKGWIVGGYDKKNGTYVFRPADSITRAEAIVILDRASQALAKNRSVSSCADQPFEDVRTEDWFCSAVANGYDQEIVRGKSARRFAPHDTLNRAEAASLIRRAFEQDISGTTTTDLSDLDALWPSITPFILP